MDCEEIAQCPVFVDQADNAGYADDATWILTASFVILTMQSGFGLLEIGSITSGNEVNVMLKNVVDVLYGSLAFYLLGYGIAYGRPSNPFMGLGDFLPDGSDDTTQSGLQYSKYLFQLSFAATSTTIVSGAVAMRLKFTIYCVFSFFAVIAYAFVAHWFWAIDGWLHQLGVHDFAGGGPVHLLGGLNGLVGIIMVGARKGRFDANRPASDFAEGSPTSMLFGLFMLWWGWIGFNCGSSFGISGTRWVVATRAGVSTINSSAAGGVVSIAYSKWNSKGKYLRPRDIVNGILGSLVAITPTCACVHTYVALVIGIVGSLVACLINDVVMLKKLKLDDPVGAVGVHAGSAVWGLLAVGLFADSGLPGITVRDGLFYGGGFTQIGVQVLAIVVVAAWSGGLMFPFFWICGVLFGGTCRHPRKGLRYDFVDGGDQLTDLHLHNCLEDPTGKLLSELDLVLHRETELRRAGGDDNRRRTRRTRGGTDDPIDDTEVWDAASDDTSIREGSPRDNETDIEQSLPASNSGEEIQDGSHLPEFATEARERYKHGHFQLFRSTRRISS